MSVHLFYPIIQELSRQMSTRTDELRVRLKDVERAKLLKVAERLSKTSSEVVRSLIEDKYRELFGTDVIDIDS